MSYDTLKADPARERIDVMQITDPRSGLTFEVSVYPGFRKVVYHISLAWGVKNIKPEHTALLLG